MLGKKVNGTKDYCEGKLKKPKLIKENSDAEVYVYDSAN